jgi:ferric-dicitrate binding protein FerR (iron transport regulator)
MTISDEAKNSQPAPRAFWRRIVGQAALGAAGAAGSGLVGWLLHWLFND